MVFYYQTGESPAFHVTGAALTKCSKDVAQFCTHDHAIPFFVKDPESLQVVFIGALIFALDNGLQHGQELLKLHSSRIQL